MLADPTLSWTFAGVDRDLVQRHALAFVIAALGGPDLYVGRNLRRVHERFDLSNANFDRAVDHLSASMRDAGISKGVIADLAIRLEPLRQQIVTERSAS
jgi:hemoglobin